MDEERIQGVVCCWKTVYVYVYMCVGSLTLDNSAMLRGLAYKCHVSSDSEDRWGADSKPHTLKCTGVPMCFQSEQGSGKCISMCTWTL